MDRKEEEERKKMKNKIFLFKCTMFTFQKIYIYIWIWIEMEENDLSSLLDRQRNTYWSFFPLHIHIYHRSSFLVLSPIVVNLPYHK